MKGTGVQENYVLIKVDYRDITLSRLCHYIYVYIYMYVCIMIRDNVTYEGFRVLDYLVKQSQQVKQNTNIKRSFDTLLQ